MQHLHFTYVTINKCRHGKPLKNLYSNEPLPPTCPAEASDSNQCKGWIWRSLPQWLMQDRPMQQLLACPELILLCTSSMQSACGYDVSRVPYGQNRTAAVMGPAHKSPLTVIDVGPISSKKKVILIVGIRSTIVSSEPRA